MAIISAEQFRSKAYAVIEIPGFDVGETFEIRVKRLSLVGLMSSGKIPNSLMTVVKNVFEGIKSSAVQEGENESVIFDKAGEVGKLLDIVCKEAMMEPAFEDIKDVMNDEQKLAVFQFTQGGVKSVEPFLPVAGDTGRLGDVEDVSGQTE